MKRILAVLFLFSIPFRASADEAAPPTQRLDVSAVTKVQVVGEASSVRLTTRNDAPFDATLTGRRTGWFAGWYSSWFYSDCRTGSRMQVEGTTLVVEAAPSSWMEPANCTVEFQANLRPETSVEIRQAATQVSLAGDFAAVTLDAKAADVTLDGHARAISLRGDALRSQLSFDQTRADETIAIDAHSLDASLRFAPGTIISYDVRSVAGLVDSALPNTDGAKPSVAINGAYVRTTIR